ncbi:hypothetical protein Poli38472_008283 [Pythium oligandrum]|uniref:Uncharacterized protein n=1 Tax=Pythium oligandrum TaxID=41045 RepID=A0A8K1FK45_PYTOL|nr:hypothetical protein Poli38472_008283 [Pythium oligandrum]|eukprot:TMW65641.1 hypothetical protein Poli38472_008283 [Pythium oligandrum]
MSQMPMEATYDGEDALDTLIERYMADEAIVGSFDELSDDPKMEFDELVTNDETERAPRPVKKRRRVNRLKCDVEELRRTAERLGSELHVLQQLRRRTGASTSSGRVLPTSETTTDLTIGNVAKRSVAWQAIAMRQYQQLRESEMENARLRMVLDEQLKIGQSLERLIRRGNYVAMHVSPPSRVRMLVDSNSATYARQCYELQTVVHEMYTRIDQAFADTHFEGVCADFRKMSVHTNEIHAHEARFVPMTREIVSNMIWEYFLEQRIATQAQGYDSECVGEASNSIVKSFVFNWDKLHLTPPSPLHRLLDTESAFLIQTRRELEQCLQEMYCTVHVAMADPSFNTTEAEFHDLAVGTDGIYAHGMRLVPSTRTTITRMIWDLLSDRRVTAPPRQYHSACEHDALSEIVSKRFVLNWDHLGQMTTYLVQTSQIPQMGYPQTVHPFVFMAGDKSQALRNFRRKYCSRV